MVWSRIYNQTKELWQEGSILLVEGKVRERADQLQVTCDRASRLELSMAATKPPVDKKPDPAAWEAAKTGTEKSVLVEKKPYPPAGNECKQKKIDEEEMSVLNTTPKPAEKKRLIITLNQTDNRDEDISLLHQIMAIMNDYPGLDELSLVVSNGTKVFKLKMGQVRIGYCDELKRRLSRVVAPEALRVETI
jgi:hypothetical protein